MIILHLKDATDISDCRFLQAISKVNSLQEPGDGKAYIEGRPIPVISDTSKAGWLPAPEQPINIPEQYFDEEGLGIGQPTVGELNLVYFTAETLPASAHYAQLIAVYPRDKLKAEVRRYFMGQWYGGIRCLVSNYAMSLYPGTLKLADTSKDDPLDPANKDSWVKVDFIEESLDGSEKVIPIVMDKVEL